MRKRACLYSYNATSPGHFWGHKVFGNRPMFIVQPLVNGALVRDENNCALTLVFCLN